MSSHNGQVVKNLLIDIVIEVSSICCSLYIIDVVKFYDSKYTFLEDDYLNQFVKYFVLFSLRNECIINLQNQL